jgi:hypothetical protein
MNAGLSLVLSPPAGDGVDAGDLAPLPAPLERHHEQSSGPAAVALRGGTVSLGEQAQQALWLAWRTARRRVRDQLAEEGSLLHRGYTYRPPSLEQVREHARSRSWVPAGHEGGIAETMGVIFYTLIAPAGVAFGNAVSGIWSRQISFYIAMVFIIPVTVMTVIGLVSFFG